MLKICSYGLLFIILVLVSSGVFAAAPLISDPAQNPYAVKDICQYATDGIGLFEHGSNMAYVNGTLFFVRNEGIHGYELWKSDGTDSGTVMVKDIAEGPNSSTPDWFTNVNGTLYFRANDGVHYIELWKSDGTEAGTVMVKDIVPGSSNLGSPHSLTEFNGLLYFVANDGTSGYELWKSDGTEGGTVMVKDIRVGSEGSSPYNLVKVGCSLFFSAYGDDGVNGIWKSDGTEAGTVLVKGITDLYIDSLTDVNGTLFFVTSDENGCSNSVLWRSDGTEAGTVIVQDYHCDYYMSSNLVLNLTNVNGTLFFDAYDGVHGQELWKSDGTTEGTMLVKDIYPGNEGGITYPDLLTAVNGILFFVDYTELYGYTLWKSDGTEAGTVMLTKGSNPGELTDFYGTLVFTVDDGTHGYEFWRSDGTEAGTFMVKDIYSGGQSSYSGNYIVGNRTLFFTANDGVNGEELWKSDGTPEGTLLVGNQFFCTDCKLSLLTDYNGSVVFAANDSLNGEELWRSDGTEEGTFMVKDINPGPGSSSPSGFSVMNGILYFRAGDGVHGSEPWRSDGTDAGTFMLKDICSGGNNSYSFPSQFTTINNMLFFSADDGIHSRELWKSDGTETGTVMVRDLFTDVVLSFPQAIDANGTLFFTAGTWDGAAWDHITKLCKSNGTLSGTRIIKVLGTYDNKYYLKYAGGVIFFTCWNSASGVELWKTDGTEAGSVLVKDIRAGSSSSSPASLIQYNNSLFFTATDGTYGRELWKSDGTASGTVMVKDIYPGSGSCTAASLTIVNDTLFFAASDSTNGTELWKTDGTSAGTVLVKDINPGSASSAPDNLAAVNGFLYFKADDGVHGKELWRSDGTESGTVLVADLNPGVLSTYTNSICFSPAGQRLFFTGNESPYGGHGFWAYSLGLNYSANNFAMDIGGCLDSGVMISWSAPSDWGDGGPSGRSFDVLRDGSALVEGLPETVLSYTDTTGENGVTYLYRVRANNGCGLSATTAGATSADVLGTVLDEVGSFDMTGWSSVPGAEGYRVFRGRLSDLPNLLTSDPDGCLRYEGTETSLDLSGDDPSGEAGRCYWYLVTAYTGDCQGDAGEGTEFERYLSSSGTCLY